MKVILYQPQIPQNTGNIVRTCAAAAAGLVLVRPLGFSTNNRHLKRAGLDYWDGVEVEEIDDLPSYLYRERLKNLELAKEAAQIFCSGASSFVLEQSASEAAESTKKSGGFFCRGAGEPGRTARREKFTAKLTPAKTDFSITSGIKEDRPIFFFSSKAVQCYSDALYPSDSLLIFGSETDGLPMHYREKWPDRFFKIPMSPNARCLNLACSVSIVLFEALRQNHFLNSENSKETRTLSRADVASGR